MINTNSFAQRALAALGAVALTVTLLVSSFAYPAVTTATSFATVLA